MTHQHDRYWPNNKTVRIFPFLVHCGAIGLCGLRDRNGLMGNSRSHVESGRCFHSSSEQTGRARFAGTCRRCGTPDDPRIPWRGSNATEGLSSAVDGRHLREQRSCRTASAEADKFCINRFNEPVEVPVQHSRKADGKEDHGRSRVQSVIRQGSR